MYRYFQCLCTSRKSGLIIKWQKRAHAAKVFCNLRGLTQQGFNTATPPRCLSPPPPSFRFKGFGLKSYLRRKNDYTAYSPHQTPPIFMSLSLPSCFLSDWLQYLISISLSPPPPCNGSCLLLSPLLAHLPITVETVLDWWLLECVSLVWCVAVVVNKRWKGDKGHGLHSMIQWYTWV